MNVTIGKLLLCITLILIQPSFAEDFRTWTDVSSGRTLSAKIIKKKIKGDAAYVEIKGGKRVWLQAKELSKEDQKFINDWVKPVDHLSVRVVGTGKGYKIVEITANAGVRPMKVVTWKPIGRKKKAHVMKLGTGETKVYRVKVVRNYDCKAYGGVRGRKRWNYPNLVDHESHDRKTGF